MKAEIRATYNGGIWFEVWRPIEIFKTLDQAIQHCAEEGYLVDDRDIRHLRTVYTIEPDTDKEWITKW